MQLKARKSVANNVIMPLKRVLYSIDSSTNYKCSSPLKDMETHLQIHYLGNVWFPPFLWVVNEQVTGGKGSTHTPAFTIDAHARILYRGLPISQTPKERMIYFLPPIFCWVLDQYPKSLLDQEGRPVDIAKCSVLLLASQPATVVYWLACWPWIQILT